MARAGAQGPMPPQKRTNSKGTILPCTCDPDHRLRRVLREELQRFQGNMKELRDEQYAKLKASMESKGFFAPVFVWAGHEVVLDGHQRLNVLERERWDVEGGIPVVDIEAADEKDAAEKLLLLSSTYGKVDPQGLYEFTETHGVKLTEFTLPDLPDFDLPKFTAEYYEEAEDAGGEEPARGEPPADPVTRSGDLWVCGRHRVLCGDSTNPQHVERLTQGKEIAVVITDPPYNVGLEYDDIVDDSKSASVYEQMMRDWFMLAKSLSQSCVVLTPGITNLPLWIASIERTHKVLAWVKENNCTRNYIGLTSGYQCWEPVLVYGKAKKCVLRDVVSIPIGLQADAEGHPCPKSLKFWSWLMEQFSDPDDVLFEPFCGSGTSVIAAEMLGRVCLGIDLTPAYCDLTVTRWQVMTNQPATLEGDGRTFDEIAAERVPDA